MGIAHGSSGKRGKETGVKDAPDLIFAAEFLPELPVGPAFRKHLIENYISLDTDIIAHEDQPVTASISGRGHECSDEDRYCLPGTGRGIVQVS
jgi:hypothetical protein